MSTASVTNTFVNAATADAGEVNTNFSDLVTFLNGSVVHVDGSKAFTGVQSGVTPTADAHLATKYYVDEIGPLSSIALTGSAQTIANSTETQLAFNNQPYSEDTEYFTNDTTTNYQILVKKAGIYLVMAQVAWAGDATGERRLHIAANGAYAGQASVWPSDGNACNHQVSNIFDADVNSYFKVWVRQTSGGNLDVQAGAASTWLRVVRLGASRAY